MELKETIASRIKLLRELNKLSQLQIANFLGTTQASIARYEQGVVYPKNEHLLWYAERFNVSLDWIYGRTDNLKIGFLKKNVKDYMSEDLKKIIGNELQPGQDIYEMIKARVDELTEKANKKKNKRK